MKPSERILILLLGVFLTFFYTTSLSAQSRSFTVVIDPGHGGRDPGALGSTSKEKDIVLSVGLKLGKLIENNHPDVTVLYTRDKDVFVPLNQRASIANKAHADLFISIHCNALDRKRTSPQGVETFILGLHRSNDNLDVAKAENAVIMYEEDYSVKYEGFNPNEPESYIIFEFMANEFLDQSVQLASLVQTQLVSNSKRVNRNVRQAGFLVLREVAMPSILVELGYISNKQEESYLKSSNGQTSLANSIYNGFREYKREHDKKSFIFSNQSPRPTGNRPAATVSSSGGKEYRIQIFASASKLENGAPEFKGLGPVDFYNDGGSYKYTYGKTDNPNDLKSELREVKKKFKDAFIVEFENGKRVK
ncbi:MAG: N-acetylmuramoyl-L-alanine amidase [Fermentimonas sp.]|nr:N-acetylmuramoyl-L-alanine amidase [Fermentimonas sp.]